MKHKFAIFDAATRNTNTNEFRTDGVEAESIIFTTDLIDNTGSILHEFVAIHLGKMIFVVIKAFEQLLIRFKTKLQYAARERAHRLKSAIKKVE